MVLRATIVWLVLLILAIGLGALRETAIAPRLGEQAGHVAGTLMVIAAFVAVTFASVRFIDPKLRPGPLLRVGIGWCLATVAFEFLFGRYVAGHPWSRLLHDYDLAAGRLWVLVLATLLGTPWAAGLLLRGR